MSKIKNNKIKEQWNFIFKDPTMIPVYMILLAVWLIKFYSEKLKKCHGVKEIIEILESH